MYADNESWYTLPLFWKMWYPHAFSRPFAGLRLCPFWVSRPGGNRGKGEPSRTRPDWPRGQLTACPSVPHPEALVLALFPLLTDFMFIINTLTHTLTDTYTHKHWDASHTMQHIWCAATKARLIYVGCTATLWWMVKMVVLYLYPTYHLLERSLKE